jgi:radical SAM family RiPP maturation amino acid epimerase
MTAQSITIGQSKRFLECWSSDPGFKQMIIQAPEQAMKKYHFTFHPKELRLLWDREYATRKNPVSVPYPVQQYREFIKQKLSHRDLLRNESSSTDPRINAWRNRQMKRCLSQLGPEKYGSIVHSPFAVELNKGCSVGCWFCAYSAPKLSALFRYTGENKTLWQATLRTLREIWGENAKHGFCYWATEPLDNPDYEQFITDFYTILGYFPQTTTATPLRDIERTRRLIALSKENNGFVERFSIHSLEQLEKVHRTFSADELKWVELVTQNEESDNGYVQSGKILDGADKTGKRIVTNASTIACVSGFLLNMVDQSVQLITPCISSKRWPKGYIIYDEAHFADAEKLRTVLEHMIERHMPLTLERNQLARFRHDLSVQIENKGFSLHLKNPTYQASPQNFIHGSGQTLHPKLDDLARLIDQGKQTAGELALHFEEREGIFPAETFHCLNTLMSLGVLQEGPDEE